MPQGYVALSCDRPQTTLPPAPRRWRNPTVAISTYELQVSNQSNSNQQVYTEVTYENRQDQQQLEAALMAPGEVDALGSPPSPSAPLPPEAHPSEPLAAETEALNEAPNWQPRLAIAPPQQVLAPGDTAPLILTVCRRLPWLGWPRRRRLQVAATLGDPTVEFRQAQQTLALDVFPVIPFWLQIFSGVTGLLLVLLLWWFYANQGHQGTINSLNFSGQGEELLSASDDQSLRRWRVDGREIIGRRQLIRTNKAVRVAQYRPVDNNQLWVGFENGDIQGWDLLLDREYTLSFNRDDRIFDLVLPNQGQTLLSGHGSGQVLAWNIAPGQIPLAQSEPLDSIDLGFAIQSMALLGNAQSHLAVAGRFNRLVLLNLSGGSAPQIVGNYPSGDGNEYILDVATADNKPNLLAVADNQGRMSLWNVNNCLPQTTVENGEITGGTETPCQLIDDWLTGHGGLPVRTVALTADGCYLVSGGDDGRVMLWPLNSQGRRRSDAQEGQQLTDFRRPVTAVNVLQTPRRLLVAYGLENGTVKVRSRPIRASNLPPGECSISSP
ncbi:MAG: WD40 repeat domain-containing protein [Leptolyngbya sp. RL_3_1]|nr:WD40 repeat domain-containing protein [Leptolyngbya sp. RL_3_1]